MTNIKSMKTLEEVETYRKSVNEACDAQKEYITLCNEAIQLSNKSFPYIKDAFEALSPNLFESKDGKNIINKYTKTIRESKTLSSMHTLCENVRKGNNNMDVDFFIKSIAETDWDVNPRRLSEESNKLGRVLAEAYLFIGKEAKALLPKENSSLSLAINFIAENKKSSKNIAEYSNAVNIIREHVAKNEDKDSIFESKNLDELAASLLEDFNRTYSSSLSKDEMDALNEISSAQDRELVFNKYKQNAVTKISEAKADFENKGDKASSDRLSTVLEQIGKKSYSLDSLGNDICSLIQLSNIFD